MVLTGSGILPEQIEYAKQLAFPLKPYGRSSKLKGKQLLKQSLVQRPRECLLRKQKSCSWHEETPQSRSMAEGFSLKFRKRL